MAIAAKKKVTFRYHSNHNLPGGSTGADAYKIVGHTEPEDMKLPYSSGSSKYAGWNVVKGMYVYYTVLYSKVTFYVNTPDMTTLSNQDRNLMCGAFFSNRHVSNNFPLTWDSVCELSNQRNYFKPLRGHVAAETVGGVQTFSNYYSINSNRPFVDSPMTQELRTTTANEDPNHTPNHQIQLVLYPRKVAGFNFPTLNYEVYIETTVLFEEPKQIDDTMSIKA